MLVPPVERRPVLDQHSGGGEPLTGVVERGLVVGYHYLKDVLTETRGGERCAHVQQQVDHRQRGGGHQRGSADRIERFIGRVARGHQLLDPLDVPGATAVPETLIHLPHQSGTLWFARSGDRGGGVSVAVFA